MIDLTVSPTPAPALREGRQEGAEVEVPATPPTFSPRPTTLPPLPTTRRVTPRPTRSPAPLSTRRPQLPRGGRAGHGDEGGYHAPAPPPEPEYGPPSQPEYGSRKHYKILKLTGLDTAPLPTFNYMYR